MINSQVESDVLVRDYNTNVYCWGYMRTGVENYCPNVRYKAEKVRNCIVTFCTSFLKVK